MRGFSRWCAVSLITLAVAVSLTAVGARPPTSIAVTDDQLVSIGVPQLSSREVVETVRESHRARFDQRSSTTIAASRFLTPATVLVRLETIATRSDYASKSSDKRGHEATGPPERS